MKVAVHGHRLTVAQIGTNVAGGKAAVSATRKLQALTVLSPARSSPLNDSGPLVGASRHWIRDGLASEILRGMRLPPTELEI
jgi:hypothetical protein